MKLQIIKNVPENTGKIIARVQSQIIEWKMTHICLKRG